MFENINPKDLEEGRKHLASGSVGGGLPIMIDSGKGAVVKDVTGKEYIDCTSQAWTFNVGFGHPKVMEAAIEQIKKITHVRTSFETVPKLLLLKKLAEIAPFNLKKIGFSLHGSVANESAIATLLKNKLKLMPDSDYFGTPVMRGIVSMGSGMLSDDSHPYRVPQLLEIAVKAAKYMGAGNGAWKTGYAFDRFPGSNVTVLKDLEPSFIPDGAKSKFEEIQNEKEVACER